MNLGESLLKDFILFLFFGVLMLCWAMCEDLHMVGADGCWVVVCCTGAVFSSSLSGISSSLLSVAGGGNGSVHCISKPTIFLSHLVTSCRSLYKMQKDEKDDKWQVDKIGQFLHKFGSFW